MYSEFCPDSVESMIILTFEKQNLVIVSIELLMLLIKD